MSAPIEPHLQERPWHVLVEEAEFSTVLCVEFPCCGLLMGAAHTNSDASYSCPQCEPNASAGVQAIAVERHRQRTIEGYDPAHDDEHEVCEIARAAAAYLLSDENFWPWEMRHFKPGDYLRDLAKAGALVAAEIDRVQRARRGPS